MARAATPDQRAHRRAIVAECMLAHVPWSEMRRRAGCSEPVLAQDVKYLRADWKRRHEQSFDEHMAEHLHMLDWMEAQAIAIYQRRHYVTAGKDGNIVCDPHTGEPLDDDGVKLSALDRVKAARELRAKALGMNAPTTVNVGFVPMNAIDQRIAELEERVSAKQREIGTVIDTTAEERESA